MREIKTIDRNTKLKPTIFSTIDGFFVFETEEGERVKLSQINALCFKILNSK